MCSLLTLSEYKVILAIHLLKKEKKCHIFYLDFKKGGIFGLIVVVDIFSFHFGEYYLLSCTVPTARHCSTRLKSRLVDLAWQPIGIRNREAPVAG